MSLKSVICAGLALLAFAGNSLLCRLALGSGALDAASFTAIRLSAGALVLALLVRALPGARSGDNGGGWLAALMLFVYAIAFSFAYVKLATGTGALLLFAAVQATMMAAGLARGERLGAEEWCGFVLALGGLVYLVFPGLSAPSPVGSVLMIVAGAAWGGYSLLGRGSRHPLRDTAANFLRSLPLAFLASLLWWDARHLSLRGVVIAVIAGALTSGCGYMLWYIALRELSAVRAAVIQLAVPVLAAAAGIAFLAEAVTARLVVAALLILGGVGLALGGRDWLLRRQGS